MTGRKIVGIGEMLWDRFPDGDRLGGAPANFVFHTAQLGAEARIVSRIGDDELGVRMAGVLAERHISSEEIQRDPVYPTGTVRVDLIGGEPHYTITEEVAWDYLAWTPRLEALAAEASAVCFGTLAQRHPVSRATIRRFVRSCPAEAIRYFDVNLRQAFFDRETIEWGLEQATILKLNAEEAVRIGQLLDWSPVGAEMVRRLFDHFPLRWIAVTRGAAGCELYSREETVRSVAPRVRCEDVVGAGDAFSAALVTGFLAGFPAQKIADRANRIGAYVASCAGAMPPLPDALRGS